MTDDRTTTVPASIMDRLGEGISKALAWVDAKSRSSIPDCSPGAVYRLPFVLSLLGRRAQAAHVLQWIVDTSITADGVYRPEENSPSPWETYKPAILAQGAWSLHQFARAELIFGAIRGYFDPATGGVRNGVTNSREDELEEIAPTAQFGLTALMLGHRDIAASIVEWFEQLLTAQPEIDQRLFTAMRAGTLETAVDAGERFRLVMELFEPRQTFYNPGIAAAFLARWAAAAADKRAARLADDYLQLSLRGTEAQFNDHSSVQICKFGWGAAAMLDLASTAATTGLESSNWRPSVERMAEWYLTIQHEDGRWENSPFMYQNGQGVDIQWSATVEFLQHTINMHTALAAADRAI